MVPLTCSLNSRERRIFYRTGPRFGISNSASKTTIGKILCADMSSDLSDRLSAVSDVDIDNQGTFKYVLIKLYDPSVSGDAFKYLVRGYDWAEFHADIYDDVHRRVSGIGLDTECVGGGRISHQPDHKKIVVYGYSMGFGRADHSITTEILKKKYPLYTDISFKNEGY